MALGTKIVELVGTVFFFFVMREKIPIHEKGWACRAALTRETRDILANTIILHHTQCVATPDHTIPHNTTPQFGVCGDRV